MNKQLYTYLQSQNNTPLIFLHQEMLKKKEKKIKETFFFSLSVSQSDPSRPQSRSSFNLITLFDWLKIQTKHAEAILLYSYKVHNSLPSSRLNKVAVTSHNLVKAGERSLSTQQEMFWFWKKTMLKPSEIRWSSFFVFVKCFVKCFARGFSFGEGGSFGGTPSVEYC